jgi:hypothetical protein
MDFVRVQIDVAELFDALSRSVGEAFWPVRPRNS